MNPPIDILQIATDRARAAGFAFWNTLDEMEDGSLLRGIAVRIEFQRAEDDMLRARRFAEELSAEGGASGAPRGP